MSKSLGKIFLAVLLLFLPGSLVGQDLNIEKLLKKGDSLLYVKEHEEARRLYKDAQESAEDANIEYLKYLASYKIGYSYLREESKFLAMAYFTEIQMDLSPKTLRDFALHKLVSLEIHIISYSSVKTEFNPSKTEEEANKYVSYLGVDEQYRLRYLIAEIYVQRLERKKAIERFKELLNNHISDPWLYELSFLSIAKQYERLLEFQQAIEYYNVLEERDLLYISKAIVFENLWICYYKLHVYDIAIEYLQKAAVYYPEQEKQVSLIENLQYQGNAFFMLGDNKQAISMFDKAEIVSIEKSDVNSLVNVYLKKLYYYRKIGDYFNAEKYLMKCYEHRYYLDNNYVAFFDVYKQLVRFYSNQNNFQKALLLVDEFDSVPIITRFPQANPLDLKIRYRIVLIGKGLLFRRIWEQDSTQFKFLEQAHNTFKSVLKISQEMYSNLEHEKTKLQILRSLRIDYENLFLTTISLYNITQDSKYLEELFQLQQKGKATLFKSIMQESEALYAASIPDNILQKELELRKQVERLTFYINPTTSKELTKDIIENLHEELVRAKLNYDSLMNYLDAEYPDYHQQKVGIKEYKIQEIQESLEEDQFVIDYFISEGRLFKMLINKTEFKIIESKFEENLQEDLVAYRALIQDKTQNKKKELATISLKLYKILLEDIEDYLIGKRLFIVPDKELNLIPFETLLTRNVDSLSIQGYSSLPYLIKNNPVSILYSQSQLLNRPQSLSKNSKLIGFAPEYSRFQNKNLIPLAGAKEEVQRISNFYKGKIYIGDKATKENFVEEAVKYDIIHLALHTIINDYNPKHSQLVFSYNEKPEETYLTSFEAYGIRFKADLLVLSGCNTGAGELKSGEGVMHLARDFFFAGIRNIVLTQWAVADKSSASIMEYFYKYLHEGNSVDIALQKAKIDFLLYEDPVKHHPYYWAGYISTGKPAEYKAKSYWQLWFLLLLFPLSLIYVYKRTRK